MSEPVVLVLVTLAVLDWVAAIILTRGYQRLRVAALQERAYAATVAAFAATAATALVANRLGLFELGPSGPFLAIVVTVLISAPSAWWLARYWRGDFS